MDNPLSQSSHPPAGPQDVAPDAAPAAQARWTEERVLAIRRWTSTQLSFRTTRAPGFRFTPGHYARLGLMAGEGAMVWRPYSVVSAAYDDYLEFLAILVPQGAFSTALGQVRVGDPLWVDKASYGFLTVDQLAPGRDLWLIASGTGLGPFLSILRDPQVWQRFERLVLVHSVRRTAELAYREEIAALPRQPLLVEGSARLVYLPVVTREPGATPLAERIPQLVASGRLEAAAGSPLTVEHARVMVCGNPEMAQTMRQLLRERGFATGRRGITGQMAFENYW